MGKFISKIGKINRSIEILSRKFLKQAPHYTNHDNILLEKYKAIYFLIPKVASSSLKKIFAEELGLEIISKRIEDDIHFVNFPFVDKARMDKYQDYFKFTFVRNPWDRIVSCYKNKIKSDKNFNNFEYEDGVYADFIKYHKFRAGMTFAEFILAVNSILDEDADAHFRSQYTFITDKMGELTVNFVGKFENLNDDFLYVAKAIGLPPPKLPELMKSDRGDYKAYYDAEMKELAHQRFKKDVDILGYEF